MSHEHWKRREQPPEDDNSGHSRLGLFLWIGFIVVGAFALWRLNQAFPQAFGDNEKVSLISNVAILALISSSIIFMRKSDFPVIARNIALWLVVCAIIALGYVYQEPLKGTWNRVVSELIPGYAVATSSGEMVVTERGGHFFITADAGGVPILFMVDTGASDIVLTPADARRIGMDTATLNYSRSAMTANGIVRGAPARLESLRFNEFELSGVDVTVNGAEMDTSLLGMAFLRQLKSYEVRGRQLYLRW